MSRDYFWSPAWGSVGRSFPTHSSDAPLPCGAPATARAILWLLWRDLRHWEHGKMPIETFPMENPCQRKWWSSLLSPWWMGSLSRDQLLGYHVSKSCCDHWSILTVYRENQTLSRMRTHLEIPNGHCLTAWRKQMRDFLIDQSVRKEHQPTGSWSAALPPDLGAEVHLESCFK